MFVQEAFNRHRIETKDNKNGNNDFIIRMITENKKKRKNLGVN